VTWPGTRWEPPHGHDGEWSEDCERCVREWIGRRAAEIIAAQGLHPVLGRSYIYAEAEGLAAAELAEGYGGSA
jgi:hypothetical protein